MEGNKKIVYFGIYCQCCKYYELDEFEEPCRDCLNYPINIDSHKPVYFEEKEKD